MPVNQLAILYIDKRLKNSFTFNIMILKWEYHLLLLPYYQVFENASMDTVYFTKMLHIKKIVQTKRLNKKKKNKEKKKNKTSKQNKTSKETEILGKWLKTIRKNYIDEKKKTSLGSWCIFTVPLLLIHFA